MKYNVQICRKFTKNIHKNYLKKIKRRFDTLEKMPALRFTTGIRFTY